MPRNEEQVYKPNSVPRVKSDSLNLVERGRLEIGVAIIHLVQLLPVGSSDLPGGRSESKSASGGQPY